MRPKVNLKTERKNVECGARMLQDLAVDTVEVTTHKEKTTPCQRNI